MELLLYHILSYSVHLLLRFHVGNSVEVQMTVAFKETGPNAFEFLTVLGCRRIILRPDEVDHFLDACLEDTLSTDTHDM